MIKTFDKELVESLPLLYRATIEVMAMYGQVRVVDEHGKEVTYRD